MNKDIIKVNDLEFPVYSFNTIIIGSGAAALNAAVNLHKFGQKDIAVITEKWGGGTSNNAGSDKQTYYKLSLAGDSADSPYQMAKDLFSGKCMHGDIALCEAQHSAQAFYHLVELGVPFPHDEFGGYVGFRTDHDSRSRGTSAGPFTSKFMFEALAKEVIKRGIMVFEKHTVIELLTSTNNKGKKVIGAIAIDSNNPEDVNYSLTIFNARNTILATGGPAGIYKDSVYPESQTGMTGIALKIGAIGQNLTEWQFGIASLKPSWNLSGSYQQVIPRYMSTDETGGDEKEFLNEYFPDFNSLANAIFLKGYQWPFDVRKIEYHGSSLVDLAVYIEINVKHRRVYIDYSRNPSWNSNDSFSVDSLPAEVKEYLSKSDALGKLPIERLISMNEPAVELFNKYGVDLRRDQVEIGVCVQHNNGGLKGNIWWESNIRHLFPVGEVNGSHGVYRPGGAALNAGQVGSLRAASFISKRYSEQPMDFDEFRNCASPIIERVYSFSENLMNRTGSSEYGIISDDLKKRMSNTGAIIRNKDRLKAALKNAWELYDTCRKNMSVSDPSDLMKALKTMDMCLTHAVYLEAMYEYMLKGGKSRGSYIITDDTDSMDQTNSFDDLKIEFNAENSMVDHKILEISLDKNLETVKIWREIRPIPEPDSWFEKVWREFTDDKIIG